ncbi:MAG TPA: hypothetical protein VN778_00345 [Verrucomicrobiae bacterium]|nr:hypothetical protein [Verrucomicrobiae bacterium]
MTKQESAFRQEQSPAQEMRDTLYHRNSFLNRPDEAYYFVGNQATEILHGYYKNDESVTEQSQTGLKYWVALENQFATAVVGHRMPKARIGRQASYYAVMQARLDEKGSEADIAGVVEAAQALSPEETWEYFLDQLAAYEAYLKGDLTKPVNRETGQPNTQDASFYMDLAEALWISIKYVMQNAPTKEHHSRTNRLNQQLVNISNTFLDANKVGLAIGFGSIISGAEGQDKAFAANLVVKMQELRSVESDNNFRHVYNYATQTLGWSQLRLFKQQLPKEATPLIFGSESEVLYADSDSPMLTERFEEGELLGASLSDGSRILLPHINYRHRTILGYSTEQESEIYEVQTGVNYETLSDEAKAAVEIALNAEEQGQLGNEARPRYRRLAFWHDNDKGDLLYTVIFRRERGRLMDLYPDHHGLATTDTERKLDMPVRSAEAVKDTYMVVPYDESYMAFQTFTDAQPNLFATGVNQANAFWLMGGPRTIHSQADSWLMKEAEDGQQPKYVIVPIRYYKIEEDFVTPDPSGANE